jgi:hypothetical protein
MTKKITLDLDLHYAGMIAIDSGQAMVGDPAYLDNWDDDKTKEWNLEGKVGQYSYQGASATTLTKNYGQLETATAVVFNTGLGDGLYPVYVHTDEEGTITKVVIDFEGDIDHYESD